jgi:hypothetical protein
MNEIQVNPYQQAEAIPYQNFKVNDPGINFKGVDYAKTPSKFLSQQQRPSNDFRFTSQSSVIKAGCAVEFDSAIHGQAPTAAKQLRYTKFSQPTLKTAGHE